MGASEKVTVGSDNEGRGNVIYVVRGMYYVHGYIVLSIGIGMVPNVVKFMGLRTEISTLTRFLAVAIMV